MANLEQHIAAIKGATRAERAPHLAELAALIEADRAAERATLEGVQAPAIIRPSAEMQAAERIELGLDNYKGSGKAAAFFGWINPDGTAREGDSSVLEALTVDKLVQAFGSSDRLVAALQHMEQGPELRLGPDYGSDDLNFIAMILAMNVTKGRTPQRLDAYVPPVFGSIDPNVLAGKPILGYRPSFADGAQNSAPYSHDDTSASWPVRLAARQAFLQGKPIATGTDRLSFADEMAFSLAAQKPADSSTLSLWTFTVFEGDAALTASQVPWGDFRAVEGWPRFNIDDPRNVYDLARFRSVLRGNVLR